MEKRVQLHHKLEAILGSEQVHFAPPPSLTMVYPAIVYERTKDRLLVADNDVYSRRWKYTVTVIDPDPDSAYPDALALMRYCRLNRVFTANNLNHYVFDLYY